MRFDLTSKMKDNENPIMVVGDIEVTLLTDAANVLQVIGLMGDDTDNTEKMKKAQAILFSEEDSRKISRLPFYNWSAFMGYAVNLAANGDLGDDDVDGAPTTPIMISPTTGI